MMSAEEWAKRKLEIAERNARAKAKSLAGAGRFNPDPADEIFDSRVGCHVSRFGTGRGKINQPLRQEMMDVGGRAHIINRTIDTIDILRRAGRIRRRDEEAAREFQRHFRAAGFDRVKTTNLSGSTGGGSSVEDILTQTAASRAYIHNIADMLGGHDSREWLTIEHVVGFGQSISDLSCAQGGWKRTHSNYLLKALKIMGDEYSKRYRAKTGRTI